MKIAVFYNIEFTGAKRVVMEHVKGLRKLGNYVDVYTTFAKSDYFDPAPFANNTYVYNFSPYEINMPLLKRLKKDYIDTFYLLKRLHKKIAKDIDNRNYDIVLVHIDIKTQAPYILRFLKTENVYFCLEPLRTGYEYSFNFKDNVSYLNKLYENTNRFFRKRIDRENTLFARNILAISLFDRERIIGAYNLYPKVSYLGIDDSVFKPLKVKKGNKIFFVGEKVPMNGYDLAMKAVDLIPRNIRPLFEVISWRKNNNERLTDEDLVKLYNESLVTLSLSRFDTFGLVPLESMACGVPVIALNVAAYRETISNGYTGFLVDFDPKEIADKIIQLIKNPDYANSMGKKGIEWVSNNWTWDKHIKQLNEMLIEFVK